MTAFLFTILVISVLDVGISLAYIAMGYKDPKASIFTMIFWAAIGIWAIVLL